MKTPLEPAVAALVAEVLAAEPADRDAVPAAEQRARTDALLEQLAGPPPPCALVEELAVPGAAGMLPARVYRPAGARERWPTLLFFHGGGFTIGNLDTHDVLARVLAEEGGCQVVSVGYRLAPEHPYPAGHDDARAVAAWAAAGGGELPLDPTQLAVFGDSAGGSLALAASRQLRQEGHPARLQLLAYPVVDFRARTESYRRHARDGFLTTAACTWFLRQVLPHGGDREHVDLSPILDPELAASPPTYLVLAEVDPLVDDGRAFAAALADAGVPCEVAEYPDQTHAFLGMAALTPRAREGLAGMARRLAAAFSG